MSKEPVFEAPAHFTPFSTAFTEFIFSVESVEFGCFCAGNSIRGSFRRWTTHVEKTIIKEITQIVG
jgi:hypothetical protein